MPIQKNIGILQENAAEYNRVVRRALGLNDMEDFQKLTREQAEQFDLICRENRENAIANSKISDNMRAYWQKCLNRSPEALTYEYNFANLCAYISSCAGESNGHSR